MEEFDTKQASLLYLTNPLYQQIIKQQKENKVSTSKSDIKFYRKRITSLTKEMLKGDIPDNTYVKHIYETYVNELIKYFKMIDTRDIIQKQYEEEQEQEDKTLDTILEEELEVIDNKKEITISSSSMNNCMMRKIPNIPSLDNFVIKLNDESKETRIIPVILDVNLREPSLKKKGVKDKIKRELVIPDLDSDSIGEVLAVSEVLATGEVLTPSENIS